MKKYMRLILSGTICFCYLFSQNCAGAPDLGRNSLQDAQEISKALKNKRLPVTWSDARGRSIVKLHIQYGLEEDALRYIQNATHEQIAKLDLVDISDIAILFNCQEVLRTLIKKGMSSNVLNVVGESALITAARQNRTGMMQILLDAGADLDFVSEDGIDAFKAALASGASGAVNLLLERGISISKYKQQINQGQLLFYAIDGGNLDVIRFLVNQGFDPNLSNHFGSRPLKYAISNRAPLEVLIALHDLGADECLKQADGWTAVDEMAKVMKDSPVVMTALYQGAFSRSCTK